MIYLLILPVWQEVSVQYPDHSPGIRPDPGVCPSAYAGLFYQRGLCRGKYQCCGFYEIALGAAWAVQWLCRQVFLSIVRVYGLLVLGDHMMEEPFFSKMTELMEKSYPGD